MAATLPIAAGALLLTLVVGCDRPELNTDLVSEGPPELTLMAVLSEGSSGPVETASFCAALAPERMNTHYCPEEVPSEGMAPVRDAVPIGFTVRLVFDELLDPRIEELDLETGTGSIAAADPVALRCNGQAVAYDGFYDPSGSYLTAPGGPAVVLAPTEAVASGGSCQVSIGDAIRDKDGNQVPAEQRGPYSFGIANLGVARTQPANTAQAVDVLTPIVIAFNNFVDLSTVKARLVVDGGSGPVQVQVTALTGRPEIVEVLPVAGTLEPATTYTVSLAAGVADVAGGLLADDFVFSFTTGAGASSGQ
jgi:hypothetical protein